MQKIKMPDVITKDLDFECFEELSSEENHVTEKTILGEIVLDRIKILKN